MRIAVIALVLIVGAAVILWFGEALTSWMPGSLIGGQGALLLLLLSIPACLALFSFLSHRRGE